MTRHARIIWYLFRITNNFLSDVICAETFDNSGLHFDCFFSGASCLCANGPAL